MEALDHQLHGHLCSWTRRHLFDLQTQVPSSEGQMDNPYLVQLSFFDPIRSLSFSVHNGNSSL